LAFFGKLGSSFILDSDGDGFLDPEEYAAGTDPTNPLSRPSGQPATPRNLRLVFDGAGHPMVLWDGSLTARYELWVSRDLDAWESYGVSPMRGTESTWVIRLDPDEPWRFFRAQAQLRLP
jgi:hypothetical protein